MSWPSMKHFKGFSSSPLYQAYHPRFKEENSEAQREVSNPRWKSQDPSSAFLIPEPGLAATTTPHCPPLEFGAT